MMSEKPASIVAKMIRVYKAIDCVEKSGHNTAQNYDYVKAADVVHAVRKALIEESLYAEINFDFVGFPYTVARSKDKDAPFAAVNVKCSITVHDIDTGETITGSGLGTGVDTSDKAVYKAQTGGLKYALRNLALVPDTADPEADETVDEDTRPRATHRFEPADMPDFQEAQKPAPRPTPAVTETKAHAAPAPGAAQTSFAEPVAAPSTKTAAPAAESSLPTEEQMKDFRARFKILGDDLSSEGKFKSSKGLPVNRKLLVFLLSITKADDATKITAAQWLNFFERVVTVTGSKAEPIAGGFVALAKKINKVNGVDKSEAAAE